MRPGFPVQVGDLALTCLQKQPARRYADAGSLARDLRHFLAGEPIEARPVSSLERAWRWCRRHPAVATLSALVFALLLTVAVTSSVLAYRIDQEKKQTEIERQAADDAREVAQKNEVRAVEAQKQAEINEKKAQEIAAMLHVDADVARLPAGFDTMLQADGTGPVPPGLRQRITLARVLAAHPKIILFDEANRALEFTVLWGPRYDPEMILEHAVVHLLRHRRQLERWG